MLVLTRVPGENLIIGEGSDQIVITVVGVNGNQVKLGIDAPRHISVHREEVYARILKERAEGRGRE